MDIVAQIMAFEDGELDEEQVIALFQELVNNGMAWRLQSSYGRQARRFLELGLVTEART